MFKKIDTGGKGVEGIWIENYGFQKAQAQCLKVQNVLLIAKSSPHPLVLQPVGFLGLSGKSAARDTARDSARDSARDTARDSARDTAR